MRENNDAEPMPNEDARAIAAHADTGRREPGGLAARILIGTAFTWSLFQFWYASPLPFLFEFGVLNNAEARSIHLAFALFLAFASFPALKRSPRDRVPIQDWVMAIVAAINRVMTPMVAMTNRTSGVKTG